MPLMPPQITPFLWFNDNAGAAVDFYLSIFPNSRRVRELHNPEGAPGPHGAILTIEFELSGHPFVALNGGPAYQFNPAVSFFVTCRDQAEIDYYWSRLTESGQEVQCGWLTDRFGLSWQIVPEGIMDLIRHPQAFQAMLTMKKFDLAALQKAARMPTAVSHPQS